MRVFQEAWVRRCTAKPEACFARRYTYILPQKSEQVQQNLKFEQFYQFFIKSNLFGAGRRSCAVQSGARVLSLVYRLSGLRRLNRSSSFGACLSLLVLRRSKRSLSFEARLSLLVLRRSKWSPSFEACLSPVGLASLKAEFEFCGLFIALRAFIQSGAYRRSAPYREGESICECSLALCRKCALSRARNNLIEARVFH